MKKTVLSVIILLLVATSSVLAQNGTSYNTSSSYQTAVGVKFYPGSLTIKHFINNNTALEGIAYFNKGVRITGLYEIYGNINDVNGLRWYIGPGAHVGFYNTKYGGGSSVGVDGVLGLDYKFKGAPINVSLDWQPSFEFGNNYGNGFTGNWGGLGIRYTL